MDGRWTETQKGVEHGKHTLWVSHGVRSLQQHGQISVFQRGGSQMVPDKGELLCSKDTKATALRTQRLSASLTGQFFFFFPSFTSDKKFSLLLTIQRRGIFD